MAARLPPPKVPAAPSQSPRGEAPLVWAERRSDLPLSSRLGVGRSTFDVELQLEAGAAVPAVQGVCAELGTQVRVDRIWVSGIKRGLRSPTLLVLLRLARALGVPPSHVVEDD